MLNLCCYGHSEFDDSCVWVAGLKNNVTFHGLGYSFRGGEAYTEPITLLVGVYKNRFRYGLKWLEDANLVLQADAAPAVYNYCFKGEVLVLGFDEGRVIGL